MPLLTPDPTFYPSPTMAMQSPREKFAYVALINPLKGGHADAIGVVDVDPDSNSYGRLVGQTDMPHAGDELHHFGWNACSSCLCPYAPHPHMERRYLIVPGINSSRIHILDTKPDPRQPKIVKVIEPETLAQRTGYAAPHTVHCGPDGIFMSALGAPDGNGPGGTFMMDPETFDIRGRWELDRGPQELAYDMWWHLGLDTMVTSAWGTPNMVKDGVNPELLLGGKYGNSLHVWDLRRRRHLQELSLATGTADGAGAAPGARPDARVRICERGDVAQGSLFVDLAVVPRGSGEQLERQVGSQESHRDPRRACRPGEAAADSAGVQGGGAAGHRHQSLDRRPLSCTSRVGAPASSSSTTSAIRSNRRKVSSIRLGGIVGRAAHPSNPEQPLNGGPQMVEVSRDGKRIYFTNSLYTPWDEQFYPDGVRGWMAKVNVRPEGGMELDSRFFLQSDGMRPHQVRLEGGDASSDSYCYA